MAWPAVVSVKVAMAVSQIIGDRWIAVMAGLGPGCMDRSEAKLDQRSFGMFTLDNLIGAWLWRDSLDTGWPEIHAKHLGIELQ